MNFKVKGFLFYVFICALFIFSEQLSAKEIRSAKAEKHGFSTQRLARITEFMESKVKDGTMVGGYGLIARNGKIIYEQDYGYSNRKTQTKIDKNTLFRIYSMTKPVTAVALMILYEQGKFLLDDPIAKYIPELANLEVALSTAGPLPHNYSKNTIKISKSDSGSIRSRPALRQPTIRDLLTHTAGFSYGIFGNSEVDKAYRKVGLLNSKNNVDFIKRLAKIPLQYDPGSTWHYSVSVDVIGYLIEVLSGKSLGTFLKEEIFAPLDMNDTFFVVPAKKLGRLAELYQPKGSWGIMDWGKAIKEKTLHQADPKISERFIQTGYFEMGGGGLISSTRDYLRFCQMLLDGGILDGHQILSPKTLELMRMNHLKGVANKKNQDAFGLGFDLITQNDTKKSIASIGTYYFGGAAGTRFWIDPEENMIGIFMTQNFTQFNELRKYFKTLSYQALID